MRDDPESIALREEHSKAMRESGEAQEMLREIEMIAVFERTLFWRIMLRAVRWAANGYARLEEEARIAARKTYDE